VRRAARAVLVGALVGGLLAGCSPDTVRVSFRPSIGTRYRHEVKVHSVTTIRLAGSPPEETVDDAVLVTESTVLPGPPGEARVRVRLQQRGQPDRTFVARFDRGAQLAGVEAVEGLPPSVLSPGALPHILPGAPGAPPDRPLAPGERWTIDTPVGLPGAAPARISGSGRLLELGLLDGRKVASTKAETRVPLTSRAQLRGSTVTLTGVEISEGTATRALADGAVERAETETRGEFRVTLTPVQPAELVTPVGGTLTIEVRSETRRLRP
jgi:hypothetical protein